MSASLYIGLTTLEAGIFAIFAAAMFVLLQTATDVFTPSTPYSLLRRWSAVAAAAFALGLFLWGLGASVRTSFPNADLIPGDQRTEFVLQSAWAATALALLIAVSLATSIFALMRLVADLRGPGIVSALSAQLSRGRWQDWLDLVQPPEMERPSVAVVRSEEGISYEPETEDKRKMREERNAKQAERARDLQDQADRGQLTNPIGSLLELAAASVQSRRYALVDRSLREIRQAIDEWLKAPEDVRPPERATWDELRSGTSEIFEIALAAGARSQIYVLIRNHERMAKDALHRDSHALAGAICEDLVRWARRLNDPLSEQLVTEIVQAITRISSVAKRAVDTEVFRTCILDLAKLGELLGQRHAEEVGLHILDVNLPDSIEEAPGAALLNGVSSLVSECTQRGELVPEEYVVLCDVLYVCTRSFMESPAFGRSEEAMKLSRNFFDILAELALTAAKVADGGATGKLLYDMGQLADHPMFLPATELCKSLAWRAFQIGMVTQWKAGTFTFERGFGSEERIASDVVELCARCPTDILRDAISSLYQRGITMYIPDAAQKAFLSRLESRVGEKLTYY